MLLVLVLVLVLVLRVRRQSLEQACSLEKEALVLRLELPTIRWVRCPRPLRLAAIEAERVEEQLCCWLMTRLVVLCWRSSQRWKLLAMMPATVELEELGACRLDEFDPERESLRSCVCVRRSHSAWGYLGCMVQFVV